MQLGDFTDFKTDSIAGQWRWLDHQLTREDGSKIHIDKLIVGGDETGIYPVLREMGVARTFTGRSDHFTPYEGEQWFVRPPPDTKFMKLAGQARWIADETGTEPWAVLLPSASIERQHRLRKLARDRYGPDWNYYVNLVDFDRWMVCFDEWDGVAIRPDQWRVERVVEDAKTRGARVHFRQVNTLRSLRKTFQMGEVDSFDAMAPFTSVQSMSWFTVLADLVANEAD